jgi:hypothetical protein
MREKARDDVAETYPYLPIFHACRRGEAHYRARYRLATLAAFSREPTRYGLAYDCDKT